MSAQIRNVTARAAAQCSPSPHLTHRFVDDLKQFSMFRPNTKAHCVVSSPHAHITWLYYRPAAPANSTFATPIAPICSRFGTQFRVFAPMARRRWGIVPQDNPENAPFHFIYKTFPRLSPGPGPPNHLHHNLLLVPGAHGMSPPVMPRLPLGVFAGVRFH